MNITAASANWKPTEFTITHAQACQYMKDVISVVQTIFINESGKSQPINAKNVSHKNISDITIQLPTDNLTSFPAFCSKVAPQHCVVTPLFACKECSNLGAGFYAFAVFLLGILVILANSLVIWLFLKEKSAFTGSYGKIKVSLAIADLLTGGVCFFVILPNLYMTMISTSLEVLEGYVCLNGSAQAISGGMLYVLTLTTSLYHLVFLSQQRMYAIRSPMKYKHQSARKVYIVLVVVWIMGATCATIPLWFPGKTSFGYQYLGFCFIPAAKFAAGTPHLTELFVLFAASSIIPFLLMTCMSVATGVCLARRVKRTSNITSAQTVRRKEVTAFVAMAAMQIGFTITLVPLIFYVTSGFRNFAQYTDGPLNAIMSFYLSLSNSLVNVIVYSVVDVKFRNASKLLLCSWIPRCRH